ncbi:MAG: hypothetical protein IJZ15_03345 [Oscillospiraceae bacterium]|nr:hypothetical protein [Oscillospiraceae bacterium]
MYCSDFNSLQRKYADAKSPDDMDIKRSLDVIRRLFDMCDESEYYYAEVITRHFCRIIHTIEKKAVQNAPQPRPAPAERAPRYQSALHLMRDFYNYYRKPGHVDYQQIGNALERGRKDLVNPTIKDYVARIYTFSGPKYLGKMFDPQALDGMDPVLFTYENIERILATFKTRDDRGEILRQNVNIRSALRKLNEFKQAQKT